MKAQYPSDYNPPNKGKCQWKDADGEPCGYITKAWDVRWLWLCPMHWQELAKRIWL